MKRIFKISGTILLFLILIQFGSYYFYGKKRINVSYYEYFDPLVFDVDKLAIVLEKELDDSEKDGIKDILEENYQVMAFSMDSVEIDNFMSDKKIMVIGFSVDYRFPFQAVIREGLGTRGYLENWRSELYWFFGKWILIERISTGQT